MQTSSRQLFAKSAPKKALIFVSPGRCGTLRIYELLRDKLPVDKFSVTHQMPFSRLANMLGNIMYTFGQSEKMKEIIYSLVISRYKYDKHFITSDPLSSMIIPQKWVQNDNVCIIQIIRNPEAFAKSFYSFSRKKWKSFLAHNLLPFWQLEVYPLENFFAPGIIGKYQKIIKKKEIYFDTLYAINPHYSKIKMELFFQSNFIENLIFHFFNYRIELHPDELSTKSNQGRNEE